MFINVFTQVVILLILIGVGFILTKAKMLTPNGVTSMTDLVLYTVTPCVIVKSFIREFNRNILKQLIFSFALAFLTHLIFILLCKIIFRSGSVDKRRVLRFAAIFSNCGFMSLPLQQAILGDDGVLFCATYIATFNIITWSYGILLISGDKKFVTPKKLILNPGLISVAIGLILFITQLPLPTIISEPVGYLAAVNTPLPMVIIGYHLANSSFQNILGDTSALFTIFLRLVAFPLIILALLFAFNIEKTLAISLVISASAPVAALSTMFAAKFNPKPEIVELSVGVVSFSTVLSIITMPLIITLAQTIIK